MVPPPLTRHNDEIQRNRRAWESKPILREIYADFYREILAHIDQTLPGSVVEIGSGVGNFKSVYPQALATDLFPNPWIDRVENAYHLSFPDHSVSHLILFDVFHHLRYPGLALKEFARVLVPGGRVIVFEPYISWLGYLVYGLLHPEPVSLRTPIEWAPPDSEAFTEEYYAAQGNARRVFEQPTAYRERVLQTWSILACTPIVALRYVLSGGFSKPALYLRSWGPFLTRIERLLTPYPRVWATRLLVVLQRPS